MANGEYEFDQVFDLYKLIATPLIATVDADFYTAKRFVEYISNFGFDKSHKKEKNDENDWGKLKTITFKYYTSNAQGMNVENTIEVPIISLIPLPLLQVEQAIFDMDINILGEFKKESVSNIPSLRSNSFKVSENNIYPDDSLKAVLSPLDQKKSNDMNPLLSSNLKAHIIVKQSDIPAGITKLLAVTQEANTGKTKVLRNTINIDEQSIIIENNCPKTVTIRLIDSDKNPIKGKHIFAKYDAAEQTFCVAPEKHITNNNGEATFAVYDSGKPIKNKIIPVVFTDGELEIKCNIETRSK